jgi:hypothetical protein
VCNHEREAILTPKRRREYHGFEIDYDSGAPLDLAAVAPYSSSDRIRAINYNAIRALRNSGGTH